jgi:hypothetical protein
MKSLVLFAASGPNEFQVNLLVAIGAATFSTLGAFVVQYFLASRERRNIINDKRLEALVQMREKAEYAGGYWYGWAASAAQKPSHYDEVEKERNASDATNAAWYAITLFDLYFPTFRPDVENLREYLLKRKELALQQIENEVFTPEEFDREGSLRELLEKMVVEARQILDLPRK